MKPEQWKIIQKCANMQAVHPTPVGLIVDSPWIPGYLGISTLDYLTIPDVWLAANLEIMRRFPEINFSAANPSAVKATATAQKTRHMEKRIFFISPSFGLDDDKPARNVLLMQFCSMVTITFSPVKALSFDHRMLFPTPR